MSKVLLSVDDRLLRRMDAAARKAGMTRSAYVARLAREALETRPRPPASNELRQVLRRVGHFAGAIPDDFDPTSEIRAMRDAR